MRFSFIALFVACFSLITAHAADLPQHRVTTDTPIAFSGAALGDGRLVCVWTTGDADTPQTQVMGAYYANEYDAWFGPRPMLRDAQAVSGLSLIYHEKQDALWLFTIEKLDNQGNALRFRYSESGGSQWSAPETLFETRGDLALGTAAINEGGAAAGFSVRTGASTALYAATQAEGEAWTTTALPAKTEASASPPILVATEDGLFHAYTTITEVPYRYLQSSSTKEGSWRAWRASNLPSAAPEPVRSATMLPQADGRIIAAARLNVTRPADLALAVSHDGGRSWPVRRTVTETHTGIAPALIQGADETLHLFFREDNGGIAHIAVTEAWINDPMTLRNEPILATVAPPLSYDGHRNTPEGEQVELPVADTPFFEHVRHPLEESAWPGQAPLPGSLEGMDQEASTALVTQGDWEWVGSDDGLYGRSAADQGAFERHPTYGFDGPLANRITGLGVDSQDQLWVATPGGLSVRDGDGQWRLIRGKEGLPWKELTALAIDSMDRVWIGSTRGLILHDPASETRPWYYRAGERYLPDDHVLALVVADDGRSAMIQTEKGFSRLVEEPLTLHAKAEYLEDRYNDRHRRLGLSSPAIYDDPHTMENWVHGPQPSDGLWTSYHVTATALAWSLSLEERYRESARESMEALYLLQNVTGVEGLVARTLVAVDEPAAEQYRDATNYHLTADGKYLWRDDVSSDQLDGHFLAFYTWFEHIAQFDPEERKRVETQIRMVLDFILNHNYTIPDWSGERTMWGWWTPELLNQHPIHFQEVGIYSLMMLMFLKTGWYITEEETYAELYRELIEEHDFLSNVLLEKKLFPDELNHSDDQLSAVAYYPILQLEFDPFIREGLHRGARRHALVELPERNSFFAFVYATVDREDADVAGGVQTLREMPRDRRNWRMENSHRRDVTILPNANRGGNPVMPKVLPYDEHQFERWNEDPYQPDDGGDGRLEGSGEHYLIPYWIGRYHDLIAAPETE